MEERALTERLATYDTSTLEGMHADAGFVNGRLEARDVEITGEMHNGHPVLAATVGPANAPTSSSTGRDGGSSRSGICT